MNGVPGGDVTLHAAITETLATHRLGSFAGLTVCRCGRTGMGTLEHERHVVDRIIAVLADRLPHTPPDQLATLIGGTVERGEKQDGSAMSLERTATAADLGLPYREVGRVVGPWVLDSPPAAPEPQCTCYFTPRILAPPCPRHPAAPEPRQDT